ncbi:MAG: ATP-dependent zinc metalloprotease FtsH [Bacteroidales bacterium]|jgi:cell division protease FtsH|nr:ATP-dependent zinc metalloprotease FtsH [Bacteroidales bacterium]
MGKKNNKNNSNQHNQPDKDSNYKKSSFNFYWIYAILTVFLLVMAFWRFNDDMSSIDNVQLREMILQEDIDKIEIVKHKDIANIYLNPNHINNDTSYKKAFELNRKGPHFYIEFSNDASFIEDVKAADDELFQRKTIGMTDDEKLVAKEHLKPINIRYDNTKPWSLESLFWILPLMLIIFFTYMMLRGMGGGKGGNQLFSIGKSKAQLYDKDTQVSITFKDVAGLEGAKEEVMEIVDFLKNPKKYTNLGGKIPKGALLVGPPGTGKTLLARAVAGEAKVPFFSLSGSDFVEMFVGVGASRVRDLFKTAKEKAACIIFIDEIDAVGRTRGRNSFTGVNDERENTLNQLLTEMDGFSTNTGIIILAATNRADVLDKALLRAGRFDRQIHVELPNLEERLDIFKVHVRSLKLAKSVNLGFFAKQTPGFSGADIANVCNEAALIAARNEKNEIDDQDFLSAVDRIVGGLEKRTKIISAEEKKVIAFHEAGHATVSWMLQYAAPLVKVTIVPRGNSLGAAWYLPEERQITNREQLLDEIAATLGGRASEELIFGTISTGALNDLERVTKQAYAMVAYYGLNKKIGNLSYYDSTGQNEYSFTRPYSEKTAQLIDEEVHELIESSYEKAKSILESQKENLEKLATQLLEKEVIFREDLVAIFGKRPFDQEEHIIEEQVSSSDNLAPKKVRKPRNNSKSKSEDNENSL